MNFLKIQKLEKFYNIGGGTENNCSILEAISLCELISGNKLTLHYEENNRKGDHKWYVSDLKNLRHIIPHGNKNTLLGLY